MIEEWKQVSPLWNTHCRARGLHWKMEMIEAIQNPLRLSGHARPDEPRELVKLLRHRRAPYLTRLREAQKLVKSLGHRLHSVVRTLETDRVLDYAPHATKQEEAMKFMELTPRRIACLIATCGFALSSASHGANATLSEWEKAASDSPACKTIPFAQLRDACFRNRENAVDKYCTGSAGKSSCGDLNPDALNKQLSQLKSEHGRSSTEASKLDDLKRKIDDTEKALKEMKTEIEKRLYVAQQCVDARIDEMEIWTDAIEAGESDMRDEKLAAVAAPLVARWKRDMSTHDDGFKQSAKTAATCKDYLGEIRQ